MKVWTFELLPFMLHISMPRGAQVSVGAQDGGMFVWALVDPTAAHEARAFVVAGTGDAVVTGEVGRFLGTVQMDADGTELVWHVWEHA